MATATEPAAPAQEKTAAKKKTAAKNVPALRLTLGGAPAEWHVIQGVGYVHPQIPSPVGGEREPSLAAARKLDKDPGCAVELVKVTEREAEEGRKARAAARGEGLAGAREVRTLGRRASRPDVEKVTDEVAAAAAGEE